jgi:isoamylase
MTAMSRARGMLAMLATLPVLAGCPGATAPLRPDGGDGDGDDGGDASTAVSPPRLGGAWAPGGEALVFRVASTRATRVEVAIFAAPLGEAERLRVVLTPEADTPVFAARVTRAELARAGVDVAGGDPVYYGYRVWGPNWTWDPGWTPGSELGFVARVDGDGNRMDPNKLLLDPYAREMSHDPTTIGHDDGRIYRTDEEWRAVDSGPWAPKGIVLSEEPDGDGGVGPRPTGPLRDDVVYEVHLRGLTAGDAAAGDCRGTYAGAATRADQLATLGVTAVELLPVQETWNDRNDVVPDDAGGDNYWGYSTLAFFAPDRRYACDRSPGGPTRELRAMVRAFHERGIKVIVDVVYNHTAEGGGGSLYSLRGLDNAAYYELDDSGAGFVDNTGIGASTNATHPLFRDLVLDSLAYLHEVLGVDGFRFDLASVLGNTCARGCFAYDGEDPDGVLRRAAAELPARPAGGGDGVDLIAEPWGIGAGTYQIGRFPAGWSEWNGQYRDLVRQDQNQLDVAAVTPGWLADRIAGSPELFGDDGRPPAASINYLVAHDGLTLRDLYACNGKNNGQPWPYGPSDGGTNDNYAWDHGGDPARQRQAARTGLALLMLSAGVPMITGGDEMLRSQRCNNNPYNLDSPGIWLDWSGLADSAGAGFFEFTRRAIAFRRAHPALRPAGYLGGAAISWRGVDAQPLGAGYVDDASQHFLAFRLDGGATGDPARAIYVAYNGDDAGVQLTLPPHAADTRWYRAADTGAWMEAEPQGNFAPPGNEYMMNGSLYDLGARTLAIFVER